MHVGAPQISTLRYGMAVFKGDACRVARLVGTRTCVQVHAHMQRGPLPGQPSLTMPGSPPPAVLRRLTHKRKLGAPQRRKNASQVALRALLYGCVRRREMPTMGRGASSHVGTFIRLPAHGRVSRW